MSSVTCGLSLLGVVVKVFLYPAEGEWKPEQACYPPQSWTCPQPGTARPAPDFQSHKLTATSGSQSSCGPRSPEAGAAVAVHVQALSRTRTRDPKRWAAGGGRDPKEPS